MYNPFRVKFPLFLSEFDGKEFFHTLLNNFQTSNFTKIHPFGAEFFSMRTDGQTDMIKQIVVFRNFAKAPEKKLLNREYYSDTIGILSLEPSSVCVTKLYAVSQVPLCTYDTNSSTPSLIFF